MGNEFFSEQNPENFEDLINEYTKHISQIYEIFTKRRFQNPSKRSFTIREKVKNTNYNKSPI